MTALDPAGALADMRKLSTTDDLFWWLFRNSDILYENGRAHAHNVSEIPETPSWRFKSMKFERVRFIHEEKTPRECVISMRFVIHGNDPFWTIRRMFHDTGINVMTMAEGWHDYQAVMHLHSDVWASLFVRKMLESSDG
jgi:hypothetical protein